MSPALRRALLAVAVAGANGVYAAELPTSLAAARRIADAQEQGQATAYYHAQVLMPYFNLVYDKVIRACFQQIPLPNWQPYTFVAALAADGRVLRVYREHETNVFQCMNATLVEDIFPPPPEAPFFLHIDMDFKR